MTPERSKRNEIVLVGVFDDRAKAVAACLDCRYWLMPLRLNQPLSPTRPDADDPCECPNLSPPRRTEPEAS
jgi:hypothetical protein